MAKKPGTKAGKKVTPVKPDAAKTPAVKDVPVGNAPSSIDWRKSVRDAQKDGRGLVLFVDLKTENKDQRDRKFSQLEAFLQDTHFFFMFADGASTGGFPHPRPPAPPVPPQPPKKNPTDKT